MNLARFFRTLSLVACLLPIGASASNAEHEWRFVMAHKPDNSQNIALIQNFADTVYERTGGTLRIKPIMPEEIQNSEREGPHQSALRNVYSGNVEMSQISVKHFLPFSQELDVLDMPMLFSGHEHASRVLDGDIGSRLRETVYTDTNGNLKGLAFTYSGGFRNILSTKDIDSVSDLRGMKMRLVGGRMSRESMEALGVAMEYVHPRSKEWRRQIQNGQLALEEAETIRYAQYDRQYPEANKSFKTVLETNHNLYLTMLTVNGPAFKQLSMKEQKILQEEAQDLALKERDLSIQQEVEAKEMFKKRGVKFVSLSDEDKTALHEMANKVHDKYNKYMGRWVTAIAEVDPNRSFAGKLPETH